MRLLYILVFSFIIQGVNAQKKDPVLFSVGSEKVRLAEFQYIYEKNNAKNADYSQQSVEEYLELYKKFKLKVHKAKELGLDKDKTLQEELAGYRRQLAKSYLKDKEINDKLLDEVINRMEEDINVSHIFVKCELKASDMERASARNKIDELYKKLEKGVAFEQLAMTISEDKVSSKQNGGLGFYTSPLPDGFYEFENAMYSTPVGQISKPVKSKMGYHIIKVNSKRPARGQIEISHILLRKKGTKRYKEQTTALVDSVYGLLNEGRNFENMAGKFSEDTKTKGKGGYLGYVGINQYTKDFEDAAFALENNGDYSEPIETNIGFHIIKRINKRDDSNKEVLKKRIKSKIANNDRFEIAEQKLIEDVKTEGNFTENQEAMKLFYNELNDDFFSYKWAAPEFNETEELFTLGDESYMLNDFSQFVKKSIKDRLKFNKVKSFEQALAELYDKFVDEKVMAYEEKNLENKYPDFKALMREYSEGILLFEITKQEVWDKASKDTTGLNAFFTDNSQNYMWPERVQVVEYELTSDNPQDFIFVYKYAQKKDSEKVVKKYASVEGLKIDVQERIFEKGDKAISELKFKSGSYSELQMEKNKGSFYVFDQMVSPMSKSLDEAKGYVIADYQDYLEAAWIEELGNDYPVKVNKSVLKSIIQ